MDLFVLITKWCYLGQVDLFRAERKKEIYQNIANIIEGKKAKVQKEEKKDSSEATERVEKEEDFSIDVDKVPIPPIPRKFSLVQIFSGTCSGRTIKYMILRWLTTLGKSFLIKPAENYLIMKYSMMNKKYESNRWKNLDMKSIIFKKWFNKYSGFKLLTCGSQVRYFNCWAMMIDNWFEWYKQFNKTI